MTRWFVIQSNANAERLAAQSIRELGIEAYLPEYTQRTFHARKRKDVRKALFPGYLFARFDIEVNREWPRIFSRRGVSGVICDSNQRPKPVPENQMLALFDMADDYDDKILEAVPLSKDDAVIIMAGVFKDFPAVVTRADKSASVVVQTTAFGKATTVVLPREHVAPAA